MIKASTISPEAKAYIRSKLEALAEREGVQILFAIESGSRAWGFPSADSDYDVRFVYTRTRSDYLSVRNFRDVIETPLENDEVLGVPLDLNGWDIRKALRLGLNSNPVLYEWLVSPIRYIGDDTVVERLKALTVQCANRGVLNYHYDRLARTAWAQIEANPERVKVKRYCYALRPALMLRWLSGHDDLPPMDIATLSESLDKPLVAALAALFDTKYSCDEGDLIDRQLILDQLIMDSLIDKADRPALIEAKFEWVDKADLIFNDLL